MCTLQFVNIQSSFYLYIQKGSDFFNPFVPNAPSVYPLKTSENRKFSDVFRGVDKGCIGNEWVN